MRIGAMKKQSQNKPKQSQFQMGHLLVNRMLPKFLNFSIQKKFDSASEFAKIPIFSND